ncbi:Hypothetical protein Minf_0872 [Methylacidiphilum infernorum V4]|uniref:Uncharacterized protein n=1 Tax=Methylacidiphilum infernorum (isolate V4) TaxID=481448 RepID=B3E1D1_METI4|nr:Hypothetical protein Minf_0872 [Methylacidiphilum infernorum V4]
MGRFCGQALDGALDRDAVKEGNIGLGVNEHGELWF